MAFPATNPKQKNMPVLGITPGRRQAETLEIPENPGIASVFDVAACILKEYSPMATDHDPMTAMKLQKLVYYSQAWSLVVDGKPLFDEKIEAWIHGPVVRSLFELNQGKYEIDPIEQNLGDPEKLDEDQQETIGLVVKHYGPLQPEDLTALTRSEPPWQKARTRGNLTLTQRGNEEILHEDMKEYYSSIS